MAPLGASVAPLGPPWLPSVAPLGASVAPLGPPWLPSGPPWLPSGLRGSPRGLRGSPSWLPSGLRGSPRGLRGSPRASVAPLGASVAPLGPPWLRSGPPWLPSVAPLRGSPRGLRGSPRASVAPLGASVAPSGPPCRKPEEVVRRYAERIKVVPDEDCTICMERLLSSSGYEGVVHQKALKPELVGRLGRCGHMFHLLCLVAMYTNGNQDGSLQCPSCKAIYGEKTGTQPPGMMEYHLIPHRLPGYHDNKTIRIVYHIPSGIQTPEHPNPGKKFSARGFPRHCYLPDNEKGRKVLKLLIAAWDRRLIFTIGTSSTTGEGDTVVWNEIHHKTESGSNQTGHGYPDPNYLDNVLRELTAQGVVLTP
ncbi:hypothetical protein NHX12_028768 [Muraenolepis orangiensis]|uniref:E3 ubiquitin-protein ligase n=1 Tax=Muraenolepis orangiensis TaxID=630683 RepID=A0A9Q0EA09_9TELE|nr:hypothetical protein NHX12_028768 [Muraenolepis orangiensis]